MSRLFDLPLFPLGIVLYPEERLPLHIFEPRYRDMARACLKHGYPFGVVLYEDGKMAEVGCTASIKRVVQEYEDGRMDIIVEGEERFRVEQVHQEKSYLTADAETVEDENDAPDKSLVQRAITLHMKLLELAGKRVRPNLYRGVRNISFLIAHNAGLSLPEKQQLLEARTERERTLYLIQHLETLIPLVEESSEMQRKIQSNGHFKDFPLNDF